MILVMAAFAITWPQMAEWYYLLPLKLPSITGRLAVALWVWLALRWFSLSQFLALFLVSIDTIAILSSLCVPAYQRLSAAGFSPFMILLPLIPALLHLVLEPVRRALKLE